MLYEPMISERENESRVSSPRKFSSLCRVVNTNHRSVNDFRVLEEDTLQFGRRHCRDDQC